MALPASHATELRTVVDLRIDFTAIDSTTASGAPARIAGALRVTMTELIEFFTRAWHVATMIVPLAATDDLIHTQPAGAPRLEFYIQSERPETGGTDRTVRPLDMVDLSRLGAPRSSQPRDLSMVPECLVDLAQVVLCVSLAKAITEHEEGIESTVGVCECLVKAAGM